MPTPSEQKALAFIALVVLLGGVVRVVRAGAPPAADRAEQQALARQATAAESAATRQATLGRRSRGGRPRRLVSTPSVVGGVPSVVPGSSGLTPPAGHDGFPPPSPRVDQDFRANRHGWNSGVMNPPSAHGGGVAPVDLDRASAEEIEALPRIGPALARRIVAQRDSFGTFGSLEGLARVKGLGPATRKRLAPLVTFSGRPSSRR